MTYGQLGRQPEPATKASLMPSVYRSDLRAN